MFNTLFYISIPVFFVLHELEEQMTLQKWQREHLEDVLTKYPFLKSVFSITSNITPIGYLVCEIEQFIFICIAVAFAVYADPVPVCALFWGFFFHLVFHHIPISILFRSYFPGLFSSVLLLPYFTVGAWDLLNKYTILENVLIAVGGILVVFLNLTLMYILMKKFTDFLRI